MALNNSKRSSNRQPTAESLLKRMASLCAKSEQCTFDIKTKLYKSGLPADQREKIIDYLQANRYLDDRRFARAFANYKVRFSAWGKRKIRMALITKRIPSEMISEALDSIEEQDYEDALKRLIASAKKKADLSDREQRSKVFRSLMARGFESSMISRGLDNSL